MAESKTKRINRFKRTRKQTQIKLIELCVRKSLMSSLSLNQLISIDRQINKLGKKKELYDRKIKDLEDLFNEKR